MQSIFEEWVSKPIKYLQIHLFQVLNSGCNATITSPMQTNSQEKPVPSSDGTGAPISGIKSLGPSVRRREKSCQSESASSYAKNMSESSDSEARPKRQKKMVASDSDTLGSRDMKLRSTSRKENEDASSSQKLKSSSAGKAGRKDSTIVEREVPYGSSNEIISNRPACRDDTLRKEELVGENICKLVTSDRKSWKPMEKALYEKGVEIFGRKSCLIARNLMNGMKTCSEVFQYMNCSENGIFSQAGDGADSLLDGFSKVDCNDTTSNKVRRRSRFLRRRGKVRRLKYSWKSAGYHSMRKRISERKDLPCRQYNPCGCQSSCGKECPCLVNETCCEKYCGCPKTCKNRFRGCHCAKSQCRSRQCPCFAAGRECDPDVCRNCWVSCGDGTLGVPSQRGDNYECRNMKLLLKQQQRVLLGRSDVSGWGAFLKFVLDAFRKGDKLKFANHSPNPNCYAKFSNYDTCSSYHKPKRSYNTQPLPFHPGLLPCYFPIHPLRVQFHSIAAASVIACFSNSIDDTIAAAVCRAKWSQTSDQRWPNTPLLVPSAVAKQPGMLDRRRLNTPTPSAAMKRPDTPEQKSLSFSFQGDSFSLPMT
ncbi:hypothetical protein RHGRI_023387 [Rhododendron griersonianum]|uniref:CXC domain-containing protein n=1 Tax=Rhododendron griersonianum TaxID=479676 RepID=A0AAV6J8U4_9ERIC|nr:hypothetical protein RHGRI_023387 [Rhododendron griersonianum]KAG5535606.1 hypothetical protein RHGRI_023387 [Rhododendron griersonianum]